MNGDSQLEELTNEIRAVLQELRSLRAETRE
jgi:hypothetical protein